VTYARLTDTGRQAIRSYWEQMDRLRNGAQAWRSGD
jgi:hypothetical protein